MSALLVTGTEGGVGKTVVVSALAAYWQTYCTPHRLGIMQPIAVNDRDRTLYTRLFNLDQSPELMVPEWVDSPLPLPVALRQDNRAIAFDHIWHQLQVLLAQRHWVLLEGLGSLGTPLTRDTVVADLAWDWRLPTVLVVPVQAGAIAQIVAQVALARQRRVHLKGIILNCLHPCTAAEIEQWVPVDVVRSLTQVPVLGYIPHLSNPTALPDLAAAAADLTLEAIIPNPMLMRDSA